MKLLPFGRLETGGFLTDCRWCGGDLHVLKNKGVALVCAQCDCYPAKGNP